jgi:hypothetical protein
MVTLSFKMKGETRRIFLRVALAAVETAMQHLQRLGARKIRRET